MEQMIINPTPCEMEIREETTTSSLSSCNSSSYHSFDNSLCQPIAQKSAQSLNRNSLIASAFFYNSEIAKEKCFQKVNRTSADRAQGNNFGWFHDQPAHREILVTWLNQVCAKMQFSGRSLCLTLTLLDCILEILDGKRFEPRLAVLICLTIATKFVEPHEGYLHYRSIFEFFQGKISMQTIAAYENQFFAALNFNAFRPTVYDKLCSFMSEGIFTLAELTDGDHDYDFEKMLKEQEMELLGDAFELLHTPSVNIYSPDKIAAALILIQRKNLKILPWTIHLETITGLSQKHLEDCLASIESIVTENRPFDRNNVLLEEYVKYFESSQELTVENDEPTRKSECFEYTLIDNYDETRESIETSQTHPETSFTGNIEQSKLKDNNANQCFSTKRIKH